MAREECSTVHVPVDPSWAGRTLEVVAVPGRVLDELTGHGRVFRPGQLRASTLTSTRCGDAARGRPVHRRRREVRALLRPGRGDARRPGLDRADRRRPPTPPATSAAKPWFLSGRRVSSRARRPSPTSTAPSVAKTRPERASPMREYEHPAASLPRPHPRLGMHGSAAAPSQRRRTSTSTGTSRAGIFTALRLAPTVASWPAPS